MPVTVAVGAEITMAEDGSLWGERVEVLKELTEGRTLLGGAGICWMARVISATFVTDAVARAVVASCVGTYLLKRAQGDDSTRAADVEVVACRAEATSTMVTLQGFG